MSFADTFRDTHVRLRKRLANRAMPSAEGVVADIAVVIPLVNPLPVVIECLEALAAEQAQASAEIIVVDRCHGATRESIQKRFPWVRLVNADADQSIPELRAIGVAASHAEIVAMIEDHCVVCPGWLEQVRASLASEGAAKYAAVGGPVENAAVTRIIDWAAFLCEYSGAIPPLPTGDAQVCLATTLRTGARCSTTSGLMPMGASGSISGTTTSSIVDGGSAARTRWWSCTTDDSVSRSTLRSGFTIRGRSQRCEAHGVDRSGAQSTLRRAWSFPSCCSFVSAETFCGSVAISRS